MQFSHTVTLGYLLLICGVTIHAKPAPVDSNQLVCGTNQSLASDIHFHPGLSVDKLIDMRVADCASLGKTSTQGDLVLLERSYQDLRDYGDDSYSKFKREFWLDRKNRLVWDNLPIPQAYIVTTRASDLQELHFHVANENQSLLLLASANFFDLMPSRSSYRCILSDETATSTTCTYLKPKAYFDEFNNPYSYPTTVKCSVQMHTMIEIGHSFGKFRFSSCTSNDPSFDEKAIVQSDAMKCKYGDAPPQIRNTDLCSTYFVSNY